MEFHLKSPSSQGRRHELDITGPPEGLWALLQAVVSDLTDSGLCSPIEPRGPQCLHQLGKRGHLREDPIPACPLQGAASAGTSPGAQTAAPFPARSWGRELPPGRTMGVHWGSAEPGRGDRRGDLEPQLGKEQNVPNRGLGRKANTKGQLSKA